MADSASIQTDVLTRRLEQCYASAVHDVLRAMGHGPCVLPPSIRPLDPTKSLCGPIWTVEGRMGDGLDAHETLLGWTGLLSKAPPGAVVVCQPHNHAIALMGELSAETLKRKGVRGYLVDGGCRDVGFILAMGFPVFAAFNTPLDIVARWLPTAFGAPIVIGDVTIHTGDFILADRDGAVIVPQALAAETVRRTEEVMGAENKVRSAILDGMDPQDAYRAYGKF